MCRDLVKLHVLWRATKMMVDRYGKRVRTARDLEAANEFFNYLSQSGILDLIEAGSCETPLPIDGAGLRKQVEDAQHECRQRWARCDMKPRPSGPDLEEIQDKLDFLVKKAAEISQSAEVKLMG